MRRSIAHPPAAAALKAADHASALAGILVLDDSDDRRARSGAARAIPEPPHGAVARGEPNEGPDHATLPGSAIRYDRWSHMICRPGLMLIILAGTTVPAGPPPADEPRPARSSDRKAPEQLRSGLDLARQGAHDEAAAEFRRYLNSFPEDAEARFHLARSLLEVALRGKSPPTDAIEELERALEIDPLLDSARLHLAALYGKRIPITFAPDKMVEQFEGLINRLPERFEIRLRYARVLFESEVRLARRGDPLRVLQDSAWAMDAARHHLEKAIDEAPRDSPAAAEARTLLGEVQFRSGEWDAARATFEYLITAFAGRAPDLSPAWNSIGHCLYRKKDYAAAIEPLRKAFDLRPSLAYMWDLKLAYDMLGGYPADLPERYRFRLRPERVDPASPPALKFRDIAPELHINKLAGAGPCGWADYDGDGRMDLVACGCDTFCTLYRANGRGFEDATLRAGLARTEPGFGAAWADYDNDGDPDLYIARNGWNGPAPNSLLRNNGDGTFTDVAAAAGVDDRGSSFHTAWFDYDRDGWLDLVVSNGVYLDGSSNQLYRNLGNGAFRNVTAEAGLKERPWVTTIGVALGDYDDDGWPDIFFHGRSAQNRLYRNNHDGTFTEAAQRAGVAGDGTQNGYISFLVDLDSDGDLDIFTGSLAPWPQVLAGYQRDYTTGPTDHIPRLYRNNGDGTFSDSSLEAGFKYPLGIMAGGIADLDNDGYQDIYLGTGDPELRRQEPNVFYHNRRGQVFEDLTAYTGLGNLAKGHGITFHDWDEDGDLEIYAEFGGFFHGDWAESAFYLNELGNRNHWLSVRLRQPRRNLHAVGARVTVHAGPLRQAQEVTAGRGFGSTDPPILHFGLGSARLAERVEVRWPDGARQVLKSVKADQSLVIERHIPATP